MKFLPYVLIFGGIGLNMVMTIAGQRSSSMTWLGIVLVVSGVVLGLMKPQGRDT